MPRGIHHGAAAATKLINTSLTSKKMFFLLRYSIQTVVYLGMKLLGGSHESLDAANPFQRTLESLPPGVPGSGLQGWKRRRIYTRNVYIHVLYRENTIQYVSSGVAADWRQTRVPPQSKQTLPRINGANVRYFIEFAMNLI